MEFRDNCNKKPSTLYSSKLINDKKLKKSNNYFAYKAILYVYCDGI